MVADPAAGRRLRRLVESRFHADHGYVQDFADALAVTKSGVLRWFAGHEPSLASLTEIARVLGMKRHEVLRVWDGD